jgi:ABC-2 type transport system permease protein
VTTILDRATQPTRRAQAAPRRRKSNPFVQRGFATLLITEAKVWSRSPDIFWVAFPALLLALFGLTMPQMRELLTGDQWVGTPFYGVAVLGTLIPPFIAMALGMTALSIMPVTFGGFREKGILRRLSATPMRPQAQFAAHFVINSVMALAGSLLAVAGVAIFFPMAIPRNVLIVLAGFLLGMASLMALGSLIAAVVPKASAGTAVGNLLYFPLMLVSGVFVAVEPGSVLHQIGRLTPMGAAAQVMTYGWFGGASFPWIQIVAMAAWAAVITPIAVKVFRWS